MQSLLGQFYSRIKGSQEDIASEGLAYILQRSKSARLAINRIIKSNCNLDFEDITYSTQNVGDKLERPDISGFNNDGKEVLLLEAKFWASLTDNQPNEYLNRLQENSALVFICPTLRVRPVFDELQKRGNTFQANCNSNQETHSIVFNGNKHLLVKTWNEILQTVKIQLVQDNEQVLISDIDQIIGFCDTIDSNAFLPIQSEELSPKYAKRINSYYDILDKVIDELRKRNIADTKGFSSGAHRGGYTRFFKTEKFGAGLSLKFEYWAERADSPFWIFVRDDISNNAKWVMTDRLRKRSRELASHLNVTAYENNSREISFALFPLIDKTEDVVVNDLAEQIIKLLNNLET